MGKIIVHLWFEPKNWSNLFSSKAYGHAAISLFKTDDVENQQNNRPYYISLVGDSTFNSPDLDKDHFTDKKDSNNNPRYNHIEHSFILSDDDIESMLDEFKEKFSLEFGGNDPDAKLPQVDLTNKPKNRFGYCSNTSTSQSYNCTSLVTHLLPEKLVNPIKAWHLYLIIFAYLLISFMGGYNVGVCYEISEREKQHEENDNFVSAIAASLLVLNALYVFGLISTPGLANDSCLKKYCGKNPNATALIILFVLQFLLTAATMYIRYHARTEKIFEETQFKSSIIGTGVGLATFGIIALCSQFQSLIFDGHYYISRPEGLHNILEKLHDQTQITIGSNVVQYADNSNEDTKEDEINPSNTGPFQQSSILMHSNLYSQSDDNVQDSENQIQVKEWSHLNLN